MQNKIIEESNIKLCLLNKDELELWKLDFESAQQSFGLRIEAGKVEGFLEKVFDIKLKNMENDPGNEKWYSYFIIIMDDTIIGMIGPKGKPEKGYLEIGYGVSENYRNQGVATKAINALCKWYFENTEINGIWAETDQGNAESQKVLQKNGFKLETTNGIYINWKLEREDHNKKILS